MANPDSGVKFQEDIKDNPSTTPTPYQIQEFNESDYKSRILDSQFNSGKSKRDQRRFNKYINSDEGKKAMLVDTKPTAPAKIPWTHSVKPATAPANVTFDWDTFVSAKNTLCTILGVWENLKLIKMDMFTIIVMVQVG